MEQVIKRMIKVNIGGVIFRGALNDTKTAAEIMKVIPFQSRAEAWGQELYFYVPIKTVNEKPVTEVKLGDIAYWPDGHALCIFFGPTPMSTGNSIKPAAPITVVGKIQCQLGDFHKIRNFTVKIERETLTI